MRRPLVLPAAVAAAVLAGSLAGPALAGPARSDLRAKTVTDTVRDKAGDVTAVAGSLTYDGTGLHEGAPAPAKTTAADHAVDLRKVTYTVVRVGRTPALRIGYALEGPLHATKTASSLSFDGVETGLGHGYSVIAVDSAAVAGLVPTGLVDKRGHRHACAGLRQSQPSKKTVVQQIPLSCLAKVGIKAATLSSSSLRGTATRTSATSGRYTLATDHSGATRMLPLTPYRKK